MRRIVALLGLIATLLGLTALGGLTLGIGLSEGIVTMIGLVAIAQGLRSLDARRGTEFEQATTGDPEQRYHVPTPGDEYPENLGEDVQWDQMLRRHSHLAEYLREAVVETLVLRGTYDREEAETAVARGTWTDDPVAAGFLGEDVPIPVSERLRELASRRPTYLRRADRTIDALAEAYDGN